MNPRLPRLTSKEIVKILEHRGFSLVRSSGSHRIFRNAEGVRVTVPVHAGKILHPKLLKSIMTGARLTADDLKEK